MGEWFERRMGTLWQIEVQGLAMPILPSLGVDQEGLIPSHLVLFYHRLKV